MDLKRVFAKTRKRSRGGARPGMTLIELLIVVALSAVIMIALLSLYMAGQRYFFNQNSRADTIEESRMPMAWISRDIRDANQVHEGAVVINGQSYATGANCLVLDVPSIDASGLIVDGSADYVVYTYSAALHQLLRIVSPNGGVRPSGRRVMADNVVSDGAGGLPFKLKYFRSDGATEITSGYEDPANGAFIVEVELTSQGRSIQRGSQPFTETVRTQAKLRNKNIES